MDSGPKDGVYSVLRMPPWCIPQKGFLAPWFASRSCSPLNMHSVFLQLAPPVNSYSVHRLLRDMLEERFRNIKPEAPELGSAQGVCLLKFFLAAITKYLHIGIVESL